VDTLAPLLEGVGVCLISLALFRLVVSILDATVSRRRYAPPPSPQEQQLAALEAQHRKADRECDQLEEKWRA
jgi:hypothetical protein